YVHVMYERHTTLESYMQSIRSHFELRDVDFMDGIIHSPDEYILSVGNFTDSAPYTNRYEWLKVYYLSTRKRREDYLKTPDYFFRYDQGVTNVGPTSFLGRLLFGRLFYSSSKLSIAEKFHKILPERLIPVTVDLFIPCKNMQQFMAWYQKEVNFFPLWCVPYRPPRDYEWINSDYMDRIRDDLFIDLAIYGMKKPADKNVYRTIEEGLMQTGGLKTLISDNLYSKDEFWSIWNRKNFDKVKKRTDPHNIFRNLYTKTCRTMRGLE
ncbi:MAG: FAD-binding oxidoreductase, partial [Spirochaetota bacterium]